MNLIRLLIVSIVSLTPLIPLEASNWSAQARVSYLYPSDSLMRDIYGCGWVDYQVEGEYYCNCRYSVFANISFYNENGNSTCLKYRTKVDLFTYTVGLKKYFLSCSCFKPYLGLGIGGAFVEFKDESTFVNENTSRSGFSLLAKSGIEYSLSRCISIDCFVDYNVNRFSFDHYKGVTSNEVQTGGLKLGVGLKLYL